MSSNTSFFPPLLKRLAAEFIGTYILVFFGIGVAVTAALGAPIAGAPLGSLAVALAFGVTLIVLVGVFGKVSANFNPAITIGQALRGKVPWEEAALYIPLQFIAALSASWTLLQLVGETAKSVASLGATQPAQGVGSWGVFAAETIVTFFLALAVATADDKELASTAGLYIGMALFVGVLVAGPFTGGAVNPARALGPMIMSGQMDAWYMYIAGPVTGAVFGAGVVRMVRDS